MTRVSHEHLSESIYPFCFTFTPQIPVQLSVMHTRVPSNIYTEMCEQNIFSVINTAMLQISLAEVCAKVQNIYIYISFLVNEFGSFAIMLTFNMITCLFGYCYKFIS